eukprot:16614-Heterococcus_DN1.PRE.5
MACVSRLTVGASSHWSTAYIIVKSPMLQILLCVLIADDSERPLTIATANNDDVPTACTSMICSILSLLSTAAALARAHDMPSLTHRRTWRQLYLDSSVSRASDKPLITRVKCYSSHPAQ